MSEIFGGIDYSDPTVIFLLLGITAGTLVIGLLIYWITYKLKLIIPKDKLFDESYLQAAYRRYHRILIFSRFAFAVLLGFILFLWAIHALGWINVYQSPFSWYLIAAIILGVFFATVIFKPGRGRFFSTVDDLKYTIGQKRALATQKKARK